MYMQIVLQRVDGTDKETFPPIKILKFLSVRKSIPVERVIIYCLRGEEVGVWRDLLFPRHILLKKQTTYRSLTRQVSVEGKNLQKSKFPRLFFFSRTRIM